MRSKPDILGKVPPQATEIERALLATLMEVQGAYGSISELLTSDDFYLPQHQLIYKAISSVAERGAIDQILVTNELKKVGDIEKIGGIKYMVAIGNGLSFSFNAVHYAKILIQKSIGRRLISIGMQTVEQGYEDSDDVFQIITETQSKINNLTENLKVKKTEKANVILSQLENDRRKPEGLALDLGFSSITDLCGGVKIGNLIILAARPGMGKTSFVTQIAYQVARQNKNVLIFSLEMTATEIIGRIQSQMSNVPKFKSDSRNLNVYEAEKVEKIDKEIDGMQLFINDASAQAINQLRFKAEKLISTQGKLDLVIVDYLQLCKGTGSNREQEISQISRGLKELAKELNCPVIALSQLSRGVESRSDKRPMLSDLRDSGAIEQDADQVWFMFRPKYYDETIEDDIVELIISKNRHGSLGKANFVFNAKCTNFVETQKEVGERNIDKFFER